RLFELLDRFPDLQGGFGGLADSLEAAGPGSAGGDQADMADDGNGFVGHALDRRVARRTIDGVGAALVHLEGPADEIVGRADVEEILARHGEEGGGDFAVARIEAEFRWHRD